ncbi:MAG: hypothetical protein K2M07_08235 [Muribaculaceae bacterium]|nr:hypothetical protein [Muribaculaceae bacterium]
MAQKEEKCILMEFDYWNNTPLSIAEYCGGLSLNHTEYVIVGDEHDLVRRDFAEIYARVGRAKFLEVIRDNYQASPTELKELFKNIKQ